MTAPVHSVFGSRRLQRPDVTGSVMPTLWVIHPLVMPLVAPALPSWGLEL